MIRFGSAPARTSAATRWASIAVLPEPAPAMTSSGGRPSAEPIACSTASCCSKLSSKAGMSAKSGRATCLGRNHVSRFVRKAWTKGGALAKLWTNDKAAAMAIVTIHDAKTNLSKLLARVESGEEIVIARGKTPIAKLTPVRPPVERAIWRLQRDRECRAGILRANVRRRIIGVGVKSRPSCLIRTPSFGGSPATRP